MQENIGIHYLQIWGEVIKEFIELTEK